MSNTKQVKKGLVPELRFPEFKNREEWFEKGILNIASMKARIGWQNLRRDEHLSEGDYFLVTGTDFHLGKVDWHTTKYVSHERYIQDENIILKEGDVLITKDGSIGKVAYVENIENRKATLNNGIFRIRVKNESPKFIYYTFLSIRFKTFLDKLSGGSSITHLYQKDFEKYKITFPTISEQQKIASCLSSLDELISAQTEKLDALQAHKKGLMQNLFPQEGQSVPNFRFPEFEEDGEWVEKKLGEKDVSLFVSEKVNSEELTLENYISTDNMLADYSGIVSASKLPSLGRVTKFIEGDILISNIRPYLKKVWKSNMKGGASNDVLVFRAGSKVKSEFLEFILKNDNFIKYVMEGAKGVKMPRGDKHSIMEYPIRIPKSKEQQKVALCLSEVDMLISRLQEKIEQLNLHKKGLMQGLFPTISNS